MKRVLLGMFAVALVAACGSPKTTDEAADLRQLLANQTGVCEERAFEGTRAKVAAYDALIAEGRTEDAKAALVEANDMYKQNEATAKEMNATLDRAKTTIEEQKTRLENLKAEATKYAPSEYEFAKGKVEERHVSALAAIDTCDTDKVTADLDAADRMIQYVEDLIAVRKNQGAQEPMKEMMTYVVKKGDSLWKIAAAKYSDPYFWPLIYWANKDTIKDPDLIFPKQELKIDKNFNADDQKKAVNFAKTRGPWSLFDGK